MGEVSQNLHDYESQMNKFKLPFSIAFLSAAIIAFQLALIQILSISQWYHFAYMVISIALTGIWCGRICPGNFSKIPYKPYRTAASIFNDWHRLYDVAW